ncbi:MAG: restriction endonuclease, partial [Christensenellales bacterium]
HALTTQEKYPFSTPELRQELSHTMWLLNRVASAKALAKLLADDPVFGEYEIVLAAGDGRLDEDAEIKQSYDRVRKAIAEKEKTITLSVGQLTVGVTIPEWSGVLMLCNLQSPSSYMQAAFRAQNPCMIKRGSQKYRKDTAYVFDFDPARTLIIFDEFANNLRPKDERGGTTEDRRENIKNLLNFFPVLGEDSEGKMVELDAAQVLSIPRKLKSAEVVRRGFMSNFLFQNIANVFGAPAAVRAIIEKMEPAQEEKINRRRDEPLRNMENVAVDEDGNVAVSNKIVIGRTQGLFGSKVYDEMISGLDDPMARLKESDTPDAVKANFDRMVKQVEKTVIENVVAPVADEYEMKRGAQNRLEDQVKKDIQREFARIHGDYAQQTNVAKIELERKRSEAETADQAENAEKEYNASIAGALQAFTEAVLQKAQETIQEKPKELVEKLEKEKAEKEKRGIEDEIRAHLRGFSRTIPSFIMAYGDGQLTLANFDEYTEEDVFLEVTGITLENFRFLRDGGPYTDPDTGEEKRFRGHLFDEVVFDDSVMEFWNKKQALADYFDEEHEEDIFDYIPPQKTNQIFTPKWVVKKMVDALEENNPGCFDDPNNTFADLYMKSGLYITEIVKRLFRSEAMKTIYPDDGERIRHILQKQVYGMAPTRIIYLISTNYILGFDAQMLKETHNFVEADAAEASKNGALARLVDESFA